MTSQSIGAIGASPRVTLIEDVCATTSPLFCWDATTYVRQCFGFTALFDDIVSELGAP